jgi:hypothetical protein
MGDGWKPKKHGLFGETVYITVGDPYQDGARGKGKWRGWEQRAWWFCWSCCRRAVGTELGWAWVVARPLREVGLLWGCAAIAYTHHMLTTLPLRLTAEKADPRLKGVRQFQTQPQKRGQTADNWGQKKYTHKPLFDVRASPCLRHSPWCPTPAVAVLPFRPRAV